MGKTSDQPVCYVATRFGGISFCRCSFDGIQDTCRCGEELNCHEWSWNVEFCTSNTSFVRNDREVLFHRGYSSGTAVVRGNTPCEAGRDYYWEIKMLTPLYGTDVMVGVGTSKAELSESQYKFCSFLGCDQESWGYSYRGHIQHNGLKKSYGPPFGQGSIIGVHLDMWRGTLQFYFNRIPLGIAFANLKDKVLYPMICSTAAHSSMRVIYSLSCESSLQLLCLQKLSNSKTQIQDLLSVPGLRNNFEKAFWWLSPGPFSHDSNPECESENIPHNFESEIMQQGNGIGGKQLIGEQSEDCKPRSASYMLVESDEDSSDCEDRMQNSHSGWLVALN